MSEPSPSDDAKAGVPDWMQAVDESTFYDADSDASANGDAQPVGPAPHAKRPQDTPSVPDGGGDDSTPAVDETEHPPLHQKLSIAMTDPAALPDLDPALQPVAVGHVRADVERQLEAAVSVLQTRYARGVTRSLVLEFALRRTLQDLQEQGLRSALVKWLDSALPGVGDG